MTPWVDLGEGSDALGASEGVESRPECIWGRAVTPWVDLGEGVPPLVDLGEGVPPWVDLGEWSDALGGSGGGE